MGKFNISDATKWNRKVIILHIGDSSSDIIGASRVGIKTCWINREGVEWRYIPNPDYTVKALNDVVNIVGVKSNIIA